MQNIHQEEADYLAGELDRQEYDELGEFSIWKPKSYHPWARMKHFFSREYKKKKRIKKHLQAAKGKIDLRRNDVVTASDRHEYQHGDTLWKGAINQVVSNHHNPQIDFLCQSYLLDWTMTDEAFETQFNEIIKKDPQISKLLKNKKLDFLASNVLLKLKWERAEIKMVQGVETLLQNYKNKADFENQLKPLTDEYFSETQKNFPPELSSLLNAPDNKNAVELLV